MTRERVKFASLFSVKHGYAFKSQFFNSSGPYSLLTPGNFYEEAGFRDLGEKQKYYTGDVPDGYVLDEGDLLVAMTEQMQGLLGSSALLPDSGKYLHNQRLGLVVQLDERRLDKHYLYFLFNTRDVRHQISTSASGTKVRHTAPERIGRVQVEVPLLSVQRRIVEILSAYDDLIENNRRRMALLEQAARLLYQEWFFRLRFPGHEHTRFVDGVPDGWQRGLVSDFYDTTSGGTPSRTNPDFFTGDIPWVKTQELRNGFVIDTDEKITEDALRNSVAKLLPERTVLVAMYGATIGQLGITAGRAASNQACCAIMPKEAGASSVHAFLFLRENKEKLVGLSMGAAQNNINQQIIRSFPMLMPQRRLMELFNETLKPAFDQWLNLQSQNQKLRTARDLLLPRFMSGELQV